MVGDKAIRVGLKLPDGYKKMTASVCSKCGAAFWIMHQQAFAHDVRANKQIKILKSILAGEHFDSKFQDHLKSYVDLDD